MSSILQHVGNTPLVPLKNISHGTRLIWGKCEHLNPGGSVKDRIALAIVDAAEASGDKIHNMKASSQQNKRVQHDTRAHAIEGARAAHRARRQLPVARHLTKVRPASL